MERTVVPYLDARKLKALGLAISAEIGYRLSPLGNALLQAAHLARFRSAGSVHRTDFRRPHRGTYR
jgi:hypothetical protein